MGISWWFYSDFMGFQLNSWGLTSQNHISSVISLISSMIDFPHGCHFFTQITKMHPWVFWAPPKRPRSLREATRRKGRLWKGRLQHFVGGVGRHGEAWGGLRQLQTSGKVGRPTFCVFFCCIKWCCKVSMMTGGYLQERGTKWAQGYQVNRSSMESVGKFHSWALFLFSE